jgi:hypothetical protein
VPPSGGAGFYQQWYSQDVAAYDIAARSSWVKGHRVIQGERNELLYDSSPEVMLQAVVTLGEKTRPL